MNPWLRGLWDTIHFQHRCESLAAFGRRFQAKSEERILGGSWKCIAWIYVLMFGVWPHWELHWHETLYVRYIILVASVHCAFSFLPRHPFCFRMRWQLSLLVTSKEPWIIDFIAMLQCCPPTHRATVENANEKAPAQMHNAHACTHTNKHTPNYKRYFATVILQWRMMIS